MDSPEEQIAQAAKAALNRIREVKPTAPQEVIQLRKDLADLKKSNDKLRKGLDELRRQFESKAETSSDEKDEGKP